MVNLRVVPPAPDHPIATDEEAISLIQASFRDAQDAYSLVVGVIGSPRLRRLIHNTGHVSRWQIDQMAKEARSMAAQATRMAEHLENAATVFDRRNHS